MKKLLMALTMIGMIHYSANAQSKTSRYNQNYKVCKANGGYKICGMPVTKATATNSAWQTKQEQNDMTSDGMLAPVPQTVAVVAPCNTMSNGTSVSMNSTNSYEGYYKRHNIVVSYDDMHNPYEGKPSRQYDGPAKNEYRNLNYNQTSMDLPPNTGSNSK